jgi:hypothetical protein
VLRAARSGCDGSLAPADRLDITRPSRAYQLVVRHWQLVGWATTSALVLSILVTGLPAYVIIKVLAPGFYARKDMKTPVIITLVTLALGVIANFIWIDDVGIAILPLTTSAAACATTPHREYANGPTAPLNETANLDGLAVRPLAVIEDSRCPASVQCVWAGRVRISADIGGVGTRELTLGEPVAVSGGTLTLVDVRPGKRTPDPIAPRQYQFIFRFQRP